MTAKFLCRGNAGTAPMNKRSELGKLGEDIACAYLQNKKYKILFRNYKKPWGEIDVIAKAKDKTLVLVEVKTVSGEEPLRFSAEDQMTRDKIAKFKRVAQLFAGNNERLINSRACWRLDMLAITLPSDALESTTVRQGSPQAAELLHVAKIKHYENI